MKRADKPDPGGLRGRMHEVIFEADTFGGKLFDVGLILSILASVLVVMLDSVPSVRLRFGEPLLAAEWFFTAVFSVEYVLRLYCHARPLAYARSFFGVVDLMAILPTYLSVLLPGAQVLLVIRVLRILRLFRVLKLMPYVGEAQALLHALRASTRKIAVFLYAVLTLVIVFGALMYLIEGEASGFTSIPRSVYWAIVTLTTVGYGDISPQTGLGQAVAAVIMIMGYGIIAVPTGIVTVEMSRVAREPREQRSCPDCAAMGHDPDAAHCKHCGAKLE